MGIGSSVDVLQGDMFVKAVSSKVDDAQRGAAKTLGDPLEGGTGAFYGREGCAVALRATPDARSGGGVVLRVC